MAPKDSSILPLNSYTYNELPFVFFCSIINTEVIAVGLPKTVRLDDELESKVEEYIEKNDIKFSQLINIAVEKFISEPQSIELEPIDSKKWKAAATKAYSKHKHAMDKLK
jgi:predicted transcriptional regulator